LEIVVKNLLLGALALLSLSTIAHANIITAPTQGVLSYSDNGPYYRVFFPAFDRTLGTLNSVELKISANYFIYEESSNAMNGYAEFGPSIVTVNDQYVVANLGSHTGTKTGVVATVADFDFNADAFLPVDFAFGNPATRQTVLTVTAGQDYLNNPGELVRDHTRIIFGYTRLIYDYTPVSVPEPASLMLLGLGVLGAAKVARHRRQAA